ncbi:MAG: hypothetical protein IJ310_04900 [Clostridia bacterium]|nr:hypothetical protein [Clostridia bacterium]
MNNFEDSEYIVYKRLANDVIGDLEPVVAKLRSQIKKGVHGYGVIKTQFLASDTLEKMEFYSKKMREWQSAINKSFALLDRIEILVNRNKERVKYLQGKCDELGIYNDKVETKVLQDKINPETKNVSVESLNLNQTARSSSIARFVNGEVLVFKKGRVDFSNDHNKEVLIGMSQEYLSKFIERYPSSVASIPGEVFANSGAKNRILKECIVFASNHIKTRSLKETNELLGGLLANAGNLNSIEQFANELKNLFNVMAKNYLKETLPESAEEIDDKLACNEHSEFMPKSKVVAALADGLAGEAVQEEEQDSEEERKEKERETRLMMELDDLLGSLLGEDQEEVEQEQEQEEIEAQQEVNERNEQQSIDEELEKQLELELEKVLKKDDINE